MWGYYTLIIILIIYIYSIQYDKGNYNQVFLDDVINDENVILKTGDMILFKAYNNFNSIYMGSYYGHVGIIYIDPDDATQTPLLFEANGVEHMPLRDHHNKNGLFLTPLKDRIQKYKGRVFLKSLNKNIDENVVRNFRAFIDYCICNMIYDKKVVKSTVKKVLGLERCKKNTNCGELTFLSLIKLNLLPISSYETSPSFHHLSYVTKLQHLHNNYKYFEPIEIIDHPFNK